MAFLDFLQSVEIKDAFMHEGAAFVCDVSGRELLWLDGEAAEFFGFKKLTSALERSSFFDRITSRQIENGAKSHFPVSLRGLHKSAIFLLSYIDAPNYGRVILAQAKKKSVLKAPEALIQGFEDEGLSAAILKSDGEVIASTNHFISDNSSLAILVQSLDHDSPIKTLLSQKNEKIQLSLIRLQNAPSLYLALFVRVSHAEKNMLNYNKHQDNAYKDVKNHSKKITWTMDQSGRFTAISLPVNLNDDCRTIDLIGQDFSYLTAIFERKDLDQLADSIDQHLSWENIALNVKGTFNGAKMRVFLSGVPIFLNDGTFAGFRGVGKILSIQNIHNQDLTSNFEVKNGAEDGDHHSEKQSGLSYSERSAFREIAERLRHDLHHSQVSDSDKTIAQETVKSETNKQKILDTPLMGDRFFETITSKQEETIETQAVSGLKSQGDVSSLFDRETLLNLLDTASDGVVLLNEEGVIESLSAAASALSGYETDDLVGKDLSVVFSLSTKDTLKTYIHALLKTQNHHFFNRGEKAEILCKDQRLIDVFVTVVPLAPSQGYAALLRDMTTLAASHDPDINNLAFNQTMHEIRTPLNAMIGFAQMMYEERFGAIGNKRYRGYVHDIVSSGSHILTLVNRFLEQAKIGHNDYIRSQKRKPDVSFDVVEQLRKSVAFLEQQANDNGITIRIIAPKTLPSFVIDAQELRQILLNLLSNAIRFTPSGGRIVIHAALTSNHEVKISVSDNGIGMTAEEMTKALQPFMQVARKDGRTGDDVFIGTGLGLPTSKSLVENNGGRFLLLSKPYRGTTIEMFFPTVHKN
ncbi:PAS domain-containing sensor histidine kinase [Bartonella tamiae]|uniref:histidine kinase n=1 Tax=Bartonella tamiae Th239 TaxID=1094558 RepID=J0QU50_9HYPH|nr:HAMP domain-containing sensor histidine kinase [Bartonella tamiae]EJF89406.1 PAS domain S-box protein [Bartonella tamiae Th239]EJF92729.1 PAS domain S-box protein [Bartonella tamiae Th307]